MNGFTHGVGGACTGLVAASLLNIKKPEMFAVVVASSILGAYAVDLDEPHSKAGQKVKPVSWTVKKVFGHRGILHTPFFIALITAGLYYLHLNVAPNLIQDLDYSKYPWMYYLCIGNLIGYCSHLLLDALTPQGIMFFYPLSRSYITFMGWKSKNRDIICTTVMILCTTLYMLIKYNVLLVNFNV